MPPNVRRRSATAAAGVTRVGSAAVAIALAVALAAPAPARPLFQRGALCRDSKGLAKPCAPGEAPRQDEAPAADRPADRGGQEEARTASSPGVATAENPAKRPLFQRGALCRDSKGLAKPCP